MEDGDWENGAKAIGMYLNGDGIAGKDGRGGSITDDHFLLYFNADGPAEVTLPPDEYAAAWDVVIDTGGSADAAQTHAAGSTLHAGDPQPGRPARARRARVRARPLRRRLAGRARRHGGRRTPGRPAPSGNGKG